MLSLIRSLTLGLIALVSSAFASTPAARQEVRGLRLAGGRTLPVAVATQEVSGAWRAEVPVAVGFVRTSIWSPDDPIRDGAREFEVLLTMARLVKQAPLSGIVSVGNRHGRLQPETESALQRTALLGIPVVKVATHGQVIHDEDNLFIEAGGLTEGPAEAVLSNCLARWGALPPVRNLDQPTAAELAAIRAHLASFQSAFDAADAASRVALR